MVDHLRINPNYEATGRIQNINSIQTDMDGYITLPETNLKVPGTEFGLIFQGYLYAAGGAGSYTITSLSNELGLVWVGPQKAYENLWFYLNADYVAKPNNFRSYSVVLVAGEAVPITIYYTNLGGSGQADFSIVTLDKVLHKDTTGFFVGEYSGQVSLFSP